MTRQEKSSISKRDLSILDKLMANEIDPGLYGRNKFPSYINESFNAFCNFKQQILIELEAMRNDYPALSKYFLQNGFDSAPNCDYIKSLFHGCEYISIFKHKGAQEININSGMFKSILTQITKINQQKNKIKLKIIEIFHVDYDDKIYDNYQKKFLSNNWRLDRKYVKKKKKSYQSLAHAFKNLIFVRQ